VDRARDVILRFLRQFVIAAVIVVVACIALEILDKLLQLGRLQ
jgi:hypothetical protein